MEELKGWCSQEHSAAVESGRLVLEADIDRMYDTENESVAQDNRRKQWQE